MATSSWLPDWAAGAGDVIGLVCILLGSLFCLSASVGLFRFPDLYSRMHASSKPQVLGVLLVCLGIGLRVRAPDDVGMLILVGVFHMITIPVAAQMIGRAAIRTGQATGDDVLAHEWEERTMEDPEDSSRPE